MCSRRGFNLSLRFRQSLGRSSGKWPTNEMKLNASSGSCFSTNRPISLCECKHRRNVVCILTTITITKGLAPAEPFRKARDLDLALPEICRAVRHALMYIFCVHASADEVFAACCLALVAHPDLTIPFHPTPIAPNSVLIMLKYLGAYITRASEGARWQTKYPWN